MKNVQVIDGALNCEYAIYALTDEQFTKIFPGNGQNVEFIEDALSRLSLDEANLMFAEIWKRKINKRSVDGIDGPLFYELEHKKKFYPEKKDEQIWDGYSTHRTHMPRITE